MQYAKKDSNWEKSGLIQQNLSWLWFANVTKFKDVFQPDFLLLHIVPSNANYVHLGGLIKDILLAHFRFTVAT